MLSALYQNSLSINFQILLYQVMALSVFGLLYNVAKEKSNHCLLDAQDVFNWDEGKSFKTQTHSNFWISAI